MKLNLDELFARRSKVYSVWSRVPEQYDYSNTEAFEYLHTAYLLKDAAMLEESFYRVAYTLRKYESLDKAVQNIHELAHPEVKKLVQNLHDWYKDYDKKYSKSSKSVEDLIFDLQHFILDVDLKDYAEQQEKNCQMLYKITGLPFVFDGIELVATQQSNAWREEHPDQPKTKANKLMEVLIARGILEGRFSDTTYGRYLNSSDNLWHCNVIDVNRLQKIRRDELLEDIKEASEYIAQITGKPCSTLHLYPVQDVRYYQILEKLGAIKVKNYYAFDVQICDFNLLLLQGYCASKASIGDLWEVKKFPATTKDPRVHPVHYMTDMDTLKKGNELLKLKPNNTQDAKARFFMPSSASCPNKPQTDEYCGFKKGFLLGKSF